MLEENRKLPYADRVLLEKIEQFSKDFAEIERDLKIEMSKPIFTDKDEQEELAGKKESYFSTLFKLKEKAIELTDSISETLILAGKSIHSSSDYNEEAKNKRTTTKLIKELDVKLEEEDFKPLPIVSYLCSQYIVPTDNKSLSLAEANLIIAKEIERTNKEAAKVALMQHAVMPLIIHKNIAKSETFKSAFANRHSFSLEVKDLIQAFEQLKKYNVHKKLNEKIIQDCCNINSIDMADDKVKESLENFKNLILNKSYSTIMPDNHTFTISSEDYKKIPLANDSRRAVFIEFAQTYLNYGMPDPNEELQTKLEEELCTHENRIIDSENFARKQIHNSNSTNHSGNYSEASRLKL